MLALISVSHFCSTVAKNYSTIRVFGLGASTDGSRKAFSCSSSVGLFNLYVLVML